MAINEELEVTNEDIIPEVESFEEFISDIGDEAPTEILDNDEPAPDTEEPESEDIAGLAQDDAEQPAKPKKKGFLQLPVIIAMCIVIGALLGYFLYTGFLMHEPEGLWKLEEEGITVFFEFNKDGSAKQYFGTMTEVGYYAKNKADDGSTITISLSEGFLNGEFGYSVSGSRLLNNQILTLTYEDQSLDLVQVKKVDEYLTPDEDFVEKEGLTGEWEYDFVEYGVSYIFTFNADGTMTLNQYGTFLYDGIYTYTDTDVTFTYYTTEEVTTPEIPYEIIDENHIKFMGLECYRVGSATPDEV